MKEMGGKALKLRVEDRSGEAVVTCAGQLRQTTRHRPFRRKTRRGAAGTYRFTVWNDGMLYGVAEHQFHAFN